MRLTVSGKIKKKEIAEYKDAARFYLNQLLHKQHLKKLKLHIHFVDDLPHSAECTWNGHNPVRPTSFTIRLKSKRWKKTMLMNLGHECTHVKQYRTGELRDLVSNPDFVMWKGKRHFWSDKPTHYWPSPWEIDAYGRELGLYTLFKDEVKEKALLKKKRRK